MKAAVISLGSVSSQWTAEAMKKYFDQVDIINLKEIEVKLGREGGIYYQGEKLDYYDCVFLKGSFRYAHLLRSIAALLEGKVPYMPIKENAYTIVHNKLLTHLVLQKHNIPMPKTYVSPSVSEAKDLLKRVNYPIVMKFPEGTQGKGVMFADSLSSASSLLDALAALRQPFIIQEYVDTEGADIRALVVGDKVVASMRRQAQKGENRANIHAGGKGESIQLSMETIKIALDVSRALGADICGVDILETQLGPMVIEANISPGLQGLQEISTINIADEIAKFFYRKTDEIMNLEKKQAAKDVMKEIDETILGQEIVSNLQFRGERILLPPIVTKATKFNDKNEYIIKVKKGKLEIKEMNI
ncbi:MAG: RimK family alpha-L-glutamate ligase [Candidatus Woesearchaeota archaeon]